MMWGRHYWHIKLNPKISCGKKNFKKYETSPEVIILQNLNNNMAITR